jgi:hypothetical protein
MLCNSDANFVLCCEVLQDCVEGCPYWVRKLKNWATVSRVKHLALESERDSGVRTEISWWRLLISLEKLISNSVSYSKLLKETHVVWHCQAKIKLSFHQKTVLNQIVFCFTRKNLLLTKCCFYRFTSAFLPVFNITLYWCLGCVDNLENM